MPQKNVHTVRRMGIQKMIVGRSEMIRSMLRTKSPNPVIINHHLKRRPTRWLKQIWQSVLTITVLNRLQKTIFFNFSWFFMHQESYGNHILLLCAVHSLTFALLCFVHHIQIPRLQVIICQCVKHEWMSVLYRIVKTIILPKKFVLLFGACHL